MIFAKANIISLRSYASHFAKAKLTLFAISFGTIELSNSIQSLNSHTKRSHNAIR